MQHNDIDHTGVSGVTGLATGTSFPGSPANNDTFLRTDRDILYFYDGTRWLSLQLYRAGQSSLVASTTTSGQIVCRDGIWHTTYDVWLETIYSSLYVATTNTGAAFWTLALKKYQNDLATNATAGSVSTAANSPNVVVTATTAIGALLVPATYKILQFEATKTGAPGALSLACEYTYRLVG